MPTEAKDKKLTLAEMRTLVQQEMDHIPRWPKDHQSYLRASYWLWRMNSLGKKAAVANDRWAVMQKCLEGLAKQFPGVEFKFDESIFKMAKTK